MGSFYSRSGPARPVGSVGSPSGEAGFPPLREGPGALDEVLARPRRCDGGIDLVEVLGQAGDGGADRCPVGAVRQRGVRGDRARQLHHLGLQPCARDDPIDQPDAFCFDCVDATTGVEDLGGLSRSDEGDERARGAVRVTDTEARGGDAEHRLGGADADVGIERHHHATAEAPTVDHGDGGLADDLQSTDGGLSGVGGTRCAQRTAGELGDVGAGDEGPIAGSGDHHDAHCRIGVEGGTDPGKRSEHVARHGIVLHGVVEHDRADAVEVDGRMQMIAPGVHEVDGSKRPSGESAERSEGVAGMTDRSGGALDGVVVVDMTTARSGPTCTRQLADMGAEVIRIVDPHRGDIGGSDGANLVRSKQSVAIDLRVPDGRRAFDALLARADVFVENMRPAVKTRLGIGPDDLCERHPRLVYASLSGFGQTGPYADRPGVDQIAQGLSGVMSVTGPPGSGPWRVGIAISDSAAGTFLTQGVLAALFARERSGRGQWVHTSLLESMVNLMDFQACRWLTDGEVPGQSGNDHPTFFPMGTYRCADGWVNIAGLKAIEGFLGALDLLGLLHDERFATNEARRVHRDEFTESCATRLASLTVADCMARMAAADIPAGPVLTLDAVFEDPQVRHLALVETRPDPEGRPVALLRHPVTFGATPTVIGDGPHAPGADTDAVLRTCGVDDATIAEWRSTGGVGAAAEPSRWLE